MKLPAGGMPNIPIPGKAWLSAKKKPVKKRYQVPRIVLFFSEPAYALKIQGNISSTPLWIDGALVGRSFAVICLPEFVPLKSDKRFKESLVP